jgi:integrase
VHVEPAAQVAEAELRGFLVVQQLVSSRRPSVTATVVGGTSNPQRGAASATALLRLGLADGLGINELAEYLGHHDPTFTLRVYGHMQQGRDEHARSIIDAA